MTAVALALVVVAGFAHASWNLLAKGSADRFGFLWRLNAAVGLVGAPFVVVALASTPMPPTGWYFVVGTGLLHLIYFWSLGQSYTHGDLSMVYPVARGTGPLLVTFLAIPLYAEVPSLAGAAGIALIILGIYLSHLPSLSRSAWAQPLRILWREQSSRYSLLTGVLIALYTLWDRAAVAYVPPITYGYFCFAITALAWAPFMCRRTGVRTLGGRDVLLSLAAAALSYGAYVLVLTAYTLSKVSYVSAAREVGIVFGAVLGTVVLGEKHGPARLVGAAIICGGVILIALAR
ncbi:MAG: EamA family transporter [Chloroflexota bacterium]